MFHCPEKKISVSVFTGLEKLKKKCLHLKPNVEMAPIYKKRSNPQVTLVASL